MTSKQKSAAGKPAASELTDSDLESVSGAGPIPYPDLGGGGSASSSTISIGKDVSVGSSTGDSGGTTKGLVGPKNTGNTAFITHSADVKVEGSNVTRPLDPTSNNSD